MLKKFVIISFFFLCKLSFAQENSINNLITSSDYNLAMQKVNNVLIDNPENMVARFQYATILSLTQKTDRAIEEYHKILRDYPLPEIYNNLGVIYSQQGLYEKALQSFQEAIHINPKYNIAIENLGDLYVKLAAQTYKNVLANDIGNDSSMLKYIKIKSLSIDLNFNNFQKIIKTSVN